MAGRWNKQERICGDSNCAWILFAILSTWLTASAFPGNTQIPCGYKITATILAPPSGSSSSPTLGNSINAHGDVAGRYSPGGIGRFRAFLWKGPAPGTLFTLPFPPGVVEMNAWDLNDDGIMVGSALQIGGYRGFIYDSNTGQYTLLQPGPGGVNCEIFDVNASGMACGTRSIGPGELPTTAFVWTTAGVDNTGQFRFIDIHIMECEEKE